ncbi:hypothetical protein [Candidatus Uabimicrobium sp. HlEnr_7]|uniref:hypothetical protein n=1 Tax=Candidatus Uabimicrobium helgolandensis TaxID=3095367 RepID=UPI0035563E85
MSRKYRIIIIFSTALIGFAAYYFWYYRTVNICEVPVIARMHNHEFVNKTIAILPMGKTQKSDITDLQIFFKELYGIKVEILSPIVIPEKAFLQERKQYNATTIKDFLIPRRGKYFRLIGIVDEDITIPQFRFLFGLASLTNGVMTVSLARLGDNKKNPQIFRSRLFKIILHEYGHTFGLGHCKGEGSCLMQFINSLDDLDNFDCGFCWGCNNRVNTQWD